MEDIASRWKKLSLSDTEGKNVDLSKEKKRLEFVLTAKFLTRRSINIEVVASLGRYGVQGGTLRSMLSVIM